MRDDPTVVALVVRAQQGDHGGWDEIVERYAPLVWSICRRHRLDRGAIEDVGQNVWLKLVKHLPDLREPAALPGWLATTTRHECLEMLRAAHRRQDAERPLDFEIEGEPGTTDHDLLAAELNAALRSAFVQLPEVCQRLLSMLLLHETPATYAEIQTSLGMAPGGIGPTRSRCLAKLRRSPVIVAFLETESGRHV